jgi:hypothetical protein
LSIGFILAWKRSPNSQSNEEPKVKETTKEFNVLWYKFTTITYPLVWGITIWITDTFLNPKTRILPGGEAGHAQLIIIGLSFCFSVAWSALPFINRPSYFDHNELIKGALFTLKLWFILLVFWFVLYFEEFRIFLQNFW